MITIELDEKGREEIMSVIRALDAHGSILKKRLNPRTGDFKEDPLYQLCQYHAEDLREWYALADKQLYHDSTYSIYYLKSDRTKRARLSKEMTYMLLILRTIYDEQMRGSALDVVTTNREDIRVKGSTMGLITEKYSESMWTRLFSELKDKNVITFSGQVSEINDKTDIYVTDYIMLRIGSDDVVNLIKEVTGDGRETSGSQTADTE